MGGPFDPPPGRSRVNFRCAFLCPFSLFSIYLLTWALTYLFIKYFNFVIDLRCTYLRVRVISIYRIRLECENIVCKTETMTYGCFKS